MAVDTSIYGLIQHPKLDSPMDHFGRAMQIRHLVDQSRLSGLQHDVLRRDIGEHEATSQAYREGGGDVMKVRDLLAGRGLWRQMQGLDKTLGEKRKLDAEIADKEEAARLKRLQMVGSALVAAHQDPSDENLGLILNSLERNGVGLGDARKTFAATTDPEQRRRIINAFAFGTNEGRAALTAVMPDIDWRDAGSQHLPIQKNPLSPGFGAQVPGVQPIQRTMTPGETATDARGRDANAIANARLAYETGTSVPLSRQTTTHARLADQYPPIGSRRNPGNGAIAQPSGAAPQLGAPASPTLTPKQRDEQAAKRREEQPKALQRVEGARAKADIVINAVNEAIEQTRNFRWAGIAAPGSGLRRKVGSWVPGTDAYDLQKTIDTVIGNLGFKELQAMREASPTGGALGQVAVQELEMLQSTIASLDVGQGQEQLERNLKKIRTHFNNWKDAVERHYQQQYGDVPRESPTYSGQVVTGTIKGVLTPNPDGSFTYGRR